MATPMRSTDFRSVVEPILNEVFDGVYDQRADEYAEAGGDDDRGGVELISCARFQQEAAIFQAFQAGDRSPEVELSMERFYLQHQPVDQFLRAEIAKCQPLKTANHMAM